MKKLLVLAVLLAAGIVPLVAATSKSNVPAGCEYAEFYIAGEHGDIEGAVSAANMTICRVSEKAAERFEKSTEGILGVSYKYSLGKTNADSIIAALKARLISTETVEGRRIYYAYSPLLGRKLNIDGKDVNVQIACSADGIMVGNPLIMGSY